MALPALVVVILAGRVNIPGVAADPTGARTPRSRWWLLYVARLWWASWIGLQSFKSWT